MKQIMRHGSFYHEICAIGQALHTDIASIVTKNLGKLVFIAVAGGLPTLTLAILVFTRRRQGFIVGSDFGGVDLIGLGNGLWFGGKIPLSMLIIVVFVDVGIQNALQGVAAAAGLFKLLQLGQVRHKVKSKARVFQLQPIALPAGGNDFADFYVALGNLILAFGQHIVRMDMVVGAVTGLVDLFTSSLSVVGKGGLFYIPALIIIAGGDVVVMLIAQVAICKRQIVGIVSPTAVQRLAFADSAELILVHPICVLPAAVLGECGGLPGGQP